MYQHLLSSALLLLASLGLQAQIACPACVVTLPTELPADTVYLADAPDGQVGQFYDTDLSFRLPKTTTPVNDPDTPPGLTISQITILSVSNLPPGLSWQASQTVFNPANETDGCGKICGTPLLPGLYEVEVIVSAQILLLSQTTAFTFPILVLPGASITDGFTLENNTGCGAVLASFTNNLPSNGQPGYSYFWDFGNGNLSFQEDPGPQLYFEPGQYEISYQAVIDTFGYLLTGVVVEGVDCTDIIGAPDLYVQLFDPAGELIYQSGVINNAQPPVGFTINRFIGPGNYLLIVMDRDGFPEGPDDFCGGINFTQQSNGFYTNGGLQATLTIVHPTDTIRSVDTVIVYEQPAVPMVEGLPDATLCEGDSVLLRTTHQQGLQWYRDALPIFEANGDSLLVLNDGLYWVTHTTADGCSASSNALLVEFAPQPRPPVFQNFDNLLRLFASSNLPDFYHLQWFFEGELIPDETGPELCAETSGRYGLELEDALSGCRSFFSLQVNHNPNGTGCLTSSTEELPAPLSLRAFPNPSTGLVQIQGELEAAGATLRLFNAQGQLLYSDFFPTFGGKLQAELDVAAYPAGMYFLEVRTPEQTQHLRLVRAR
jgi:hypothetical protein